MADTPSAILLQRIQTTGSNTNLWGGYTNTNLETLEQAIKGYQTQALTGDTTISWTNYATGNKGQAALLKFTGSLVAAVTVTMPAYMNFGLFWNASGASITVKCSGGTGVAIPNGRKAFVFCDGTDYYFAGPNYIGDDITETNNRDIVDYAALQAAISAISTAQTGLVLNSSTATTSEYLEDAIAVTGAITKTKINAGTATEATQLSVGSLGLTDGGTQASGFTAASNTRYNCVFGAAGTITLPAAPTAKDVIALHLAGYYVYTLNPNSLKINTSTANLPLIGNQTVVLEYTGATDGWV